MAEDPMDSPPTISLQAVKVDIVRKASKATDVGCVQELYHSDWTGERVEAWWINPDCLVPGTTADGGEELLVLEGSLKVRLAGKEEEYKTWDWLRFPARASHDAQRSTLRSGTGGAKLWRKSGHLTGRALSLEKSQILVPEQQVEKGV
jgi:hypothetical protein